MKYRFVLGIGRSGTTLLGRIAGSAATPMRFISEPFHGLKVQVSPERLDTNCALPGEAARIAFLRDAILGLGENLDGIRDDRRVKIERDDAGADVLLIKEVHSLLAFPEIVRGMNHRTVVITRDTARVLDSYLVRYKGGNDKYLVQEHAYLAQYLGGHGVSLVPLLDKALREVPGSVKSYLRRPRWMTSVSLRTASTMEVIRHFLAAWAKADESVIRVVYEDLCVDPPGEMKEIYDFLGLESTDESVRKVSQMTTGNSTEYYATDKDSRKVLAQDYRVLSAAVSRLTTSAMTARIDGIPYWAGLGATALAWITAFRACRFGYVLRTLTAVPIRSSSTRRLCGTGAACDGWGAES
jgi:hypothetical protein